MIRLSMEECKAIVDAKAKELNLPISRVNTELKAELEQIELFENTPFSSKNSKSNSYLENIFA